MTQVRMEFRNCIGPQMPKIRESANLGAIVLVEKDLHRELKAHVWQHVSIVESRLNYH